MQRIRGKKDGGASNGPSTPPIPDRPNQMQYQQQQQNPFFGRGGRGGGGGGGGGDEYAYVNPSAVVPGSREKKLPLLPSSPSKEDGGGGGYHTDGDRTGYGRKMSILQKAKDLVAGAK